MANSKNSADNLLFHSTNVSTSFKDKKVWMHPQIDKNDVESLTKIKRKQQTKNKTLQNLSTQYMELLLRHAAMNPSLLNAAMGMPMGGSILYFSQVFSYKRHIFVGFSI